METKQKLFPYMDYFEEDFPFTGRINPEIDKLSLEWIDPEDILVTLRQKSCWDLEVLKTILEDFCLGRIKSVNIARIMGHNICWNGQHTIAAMLLNGWKKIPCMVYECDSMHWREKSTTHMRFSDRQRADMSYDFLSDIEQYYELKTFDSVMEKLEELKKIK